MFGSCCLWCVPLARWVLQLLSNSVWHDHVCCALYFRFMRVAGSFDAQTEAQRALAGEKADRMLLRSDCRDMRAYCDMDKGDRSLLTGCEKKGQKVTRALWLLAGLICVGLGTVGMVMPILPTTPFLLAAAACFCKSSTRMYNWLLNNKWFGEYIKNYKEGRGLQMKTKITALTVLWSAIIVSTVFFLNRLLPSQLVLPMQLIMLAVAVGVSVHVLRLPTLKKHVLNGQK